MALNVKIEPNLMRVKITGGPEQWSLKAVDMETGRIIPLRRAFIDLHYTPEGRILAYAEILVTEVDIEGYAEIEKRKGDDEAKS
jgi:hypothetical protein